MKLLPSNFPRLFHRNSVDRVVIRFSLATDISHLPFRSDLLGSFFATNIQDVESNFRPVPVNFPSPRTRAVLESTDTVTEVPVSVTLKTVPPNELFQYPDSEGRS